MAGFLEIPDAQPPFSLSPTPSPEPAPHLTTAQVRGFAASRLQATGSDRAPKGRCGCAQLRERLERDPFTARAHFEAEYDAILGDSLPQKVTEQDLKDPRAPTVAGKLLPKGI